jgi:hypothetical protein
MTFRLTPGAGLVCLVLLVTIATILLAGCTDTAQDQQGQATATQPAADPAPGTAAATRPTTHPATVKTTLAAPAPFSSTGVITIDPIGDRKTGETVTLTGTTSLPAGTSIFWQILPDTGTPPTGVDPDSQMSVAGNYQVTRGDGSLNRIAISIDMGRLVPGRYVAIVGKMKGDPAAGPVFEIGNDYAYTYITLK